MKRLLATFLLVLCMLFSCTKNYFNPVSAAIDRAESRNSETLLPSDNTVTMDNVRSVIEENFPMSKGSETPMYDISPYIGKDSDTLMYIVNTTDGNGWKIYSSDKRTPAIIAEGDKGYFSLSEGSPAVAAWISCMADDIARVRSSTDGELTFSEDEISANKAFWSGSSPRALDPPGTDLPGHWEVTTTSQTVVYDTLDHMVARWDQEDPYNKCCPLLVNNYPDRAPAGCVAIAGSQLLFYLHNKIGVPESMYSMGSCTGNIDNYQQAFSLPSTSVWSSMSSGYQDSSVGTLPEAIMIGHVGQTVVMHYCELFNKSFSWALPSNLKTNLFEPNGISCSRGSFDEDIVKNNLLNQLPIIISASNLLIPADFEIHCFVIDGYKRTRTEYRNYHYYVLDEEPEDPIIMPETPDPYITYTYSNPEITSIKINWGWASQWRQNNPVNDGWYSLTGNWTVSNGNSYDYNRNMTYGFSEVE